MKSRDLISKNREHDFSIQETAMDALRYYAQNSMPRHSREGGNPDNIKNWIPLENIDRITLIGPASLLKEFQHARHHELKHHFVKPPKVFGSVLGSMQSMIKGVCAHWLQWQINPETSKRTEKEVDCSML